MTEEIYGIPLYIHEGATTEEEKESFIERLEETTALRDNADKIHHLEIGTLASFWFKDGELELWCNELNEWVKGKYCEECTNYGEGRCRSMGRDKIKQPKEKDILLTTMHSLRVVLNTEGVTEYNEPKPNAKPKQFKPPTDDYPMPGDAVVVKNWKDETLLYEGSYGVIQGRLGIAKEEYLVCFNPSTYWHEMVSCSGGPAYYLKGEDMKLIGEKTIMTWRFKNNIWVAHNGENIEREVRLYEVMLNA